MSYENSAIYEQVWFLPFEASGQVIPFWKPPISHCLDPVYHGGGRTFRAQKPYLEIPGL